VDAHRAADGAEHGHGHGHGHGGTGNQLLDALKHLLGRDTHPEAFAADDAAASRDGLRAVVISFGILLFTASAQAALVGATGSVGLLGDCLHNLADSLTAVPLAVAFTLGRRPRNRRYNYGYARSEDLAGIAIVLTIAVSAALSGWLSVRRLLDPQPVHHLPALAAGALLGFAGNEVVARYRIRVGRRIGSAALIADGLHARTDAITSAAVLLGAGGVALGFRRADPIVGLVISVAIIAVLRDAAREVYRRLMDAVDPDLLDQAEAALRAVPGVQGLGDVRLRWIGHSLRAEAEITVGRDLTIVAAHSIAVEAEHALLHAIPRLAAATVHPDPDSAPGATHHLRDHH